MKLIKLALAGAMALACAFPAVGADHTLTGKDAAGATRYICGKDTGQGADTHANASCFVGWDISGAAMFTLAKDASVTETHATPGSDGTKAISIQGVTSGKAVPVSGTFWQTTQPVSAASLPLPTGAATTAKQPALGTAGSASTDVISVQGIASMTPLGVSAASLPLPAGASTAAKQPALGTAGSASADVITVQGAASMTALSVSAASLPLPTGAATSALQPTAAAAGSTTSGQTGHLADCAVTTAAPTYTTAQTNPLSCDTAGNLRTAAASAASENHLGEVGGHSFVVGATFTTPAGTTAYTDLDLIANSGTAGSVTPLDFATVCRVNAGTFHIWRARAKTADSGMAGKAIFLKLYRDSPTVAAGDNAGFSSTESNYIGQIPITFDQHFSDPFEKGIGAPSVGASITGDCAASSQHIYGLIQSAGGSATLLGAKAWTVVLEGDDN